MPLTKGYFALIDAVDAHWITQRDWHAHEANGLLYATCGGAGAPRIWMHRLILLATPRYEVDHKNGDSLDNRRTNLRLATRLQNVRNRGKFSVAGRAPLSKFKGVTWNSTSRKWMARIQVTDKRLFLGGFHDEVAAAMAYDAAARIHHGEFARLNFPEAS